MAFSLSQILHSRLQITWGAKGAFELRSLIRKRNQANQLQSKLLTSGPGGRRFKSSLPDQIFCNQSIAVFVRYASDVLFDGSRSYFYRLYRPAAVHNQ